MKGLDEAYAKFYATSELKKSLDDLDDSVASLLKRMVFNKCASEFFVAGFEAGRKHEKKQVS